MEFVTIYTLKSAIYSITIIILFWFVIINI